jgi:sugar phosphate isomerase/epimerase
MNPLTLAASANWFAYTTKITPENAMDIIVQDAKDLHAAGFRAIELPIPLMGSCLKELGAPFWKQVRNALLEIGLTPSSVHGPNWPALDTPLDATLENLTLYAHACTALGAHALVAHPTYHSHPHVCSVTPQLLQRDTTLARHLSQVLSDGPTKLAIENLPTYGLSYLHALLARLDNLPNVGACFDTGHFHLRPEGDLTHVVTRLNPRITHLHLTDNHGLCDEHLAPGQGTVDWKSFFQALDPAWRSRPLLVELGAPSLYTHTDAAALSRPYHTQAFNHAYACIAGAITVA